MTLSGEHHVLATSPVVFVEDEEQARYSHVFVDVGKDNNNCDETRALRGKAQIRGTVGMKETRVIFFIVKLAVCT